MAAAVADGDRLLFRHLIEVVDVERALVLHLGVVEEESLDPKSGGRLARSGAELVDDAGDGDELDLVRVADEDIVEQDRAGRVIVRIDESGHDRHLLGVEALGLLADERLDVLGASHGDEPAGLDGESFRSRRNRIDRVDLGVENDEVGLLRKINRGGCHAQGPLRANDAGKTSSGEAHEFSAAERMFCHCVSLRCLPS